MSEVESQPRPSRAGRYWIIGMGLVVLGWVAVPPAIRWYVTSQIKASVGEPLPTFSVADRDGKTWTPDALRGKRVLLHFFRSRCHSCTANAGEMRALAKELQEGELLLGVMTDRAQGFEEKESRETLAKYGFEHPVLMADDAFLDSFHGVRWSHVTPVTYVVSPEGRIVQSFRGPQSRDVLTKALRAPQ